MKLVTFTGAGAGDRVGALIDGDRRVVDLAVADADPAAPFGRLLDLVEAGAPGLARARSAVDGAKPGAIRDLAAVTLRTPIPEPPQIRDFLCFEEHLINAFDMLKRKKAQAQPDPEAALRQFEEQGLFKTPPVWYEVPLFYKPSRFGVIGTDEDVIWPHFSNLLDYEMEFCAVVGRKLKDASKDEARAAIFGYSIFNDISARDTQFVEMAGGLGPGKGKDFETGQIIGPCIVTADEFDPYSAEMIVRVNGEERSRGKSGSMYWKFEDCIAHASKSETIHPGEIFCSGTVGGGCGLELDRYLADGDVVELEVTGIGVLRNRIVKKH